MKIPITLFLSNISQRKVYYFKSNRLNTDIPHYFVCLTVGIDGIVLLVCCTSQFEKRRKFIETRNLPYSTLVWIKPDKENGLKMDSYVDCNGYFDYSLEELGQLYEADELEYKGELSEAVFDQILTGLRESPLIEESVKDKLPNTNEGDHN